MDPARLKAAMADTVEPVLTHLRDQVTDMTQKLEIGVMCEVFTRAQEAELKSRVAYAKGDLSGAEGVWNWTQKVLDGFAEREADRAYLDAMRLTVDLLEALRQDPEATQVASADALRPGGSVEDVCGILRRMIANAQASLSKDLK